MSLMSMTAFGAGESNSEHFLYRCEVKTLNSRFIDINVRMPRSLSALESTIIAEVKKALNRGKVDISFDITAIDGASKLPKLNETAVKHYHQISQKISEIAGNDSKTLSIYEFLRLDGTLDSLTRDKSDDIFSLHKPGMSEALNAALVQVIETRKNEGAALLPNFEELIATVTEERKIVAKYTDEIRAHQFANYRKKLEAFLVKLGDLGQQIGPNLSDERINTEIAIMADKADIAEELTRLEAHENEFLKNLKIGTDVGRKLDFLCQELHREVNTISSKVSQLEVSSHTLNMKQAIERLRQQIQNIE